MDSPIGGAEQSQVELLSAELDKERRKNQALIESNQQILGVLGELTVYHSEQRMQNQELRKMADQAITDELTQLPNKRGLMLAYDSMQRTDSLHGFESAVIFIDLDDFKNVNDAHGHQAGDEVLVSIAKALADRLRDGDVLGRLHGDEIVALLPGASPEDALNIAEEFRQIVSGTETQIEDQTVRVTASVGVSQSDKDLHFSEAIRKADAAMYQAKRNGKDQVVELPI